MTDDRIARLEDRMRGLERESVATHTEVTEARKDIGEIKVMLEGPPRNESIRGRLHTLEDSEATAKAAEAALTAAKAFYERHDEKRFSKREKVAGLLVAGAGLVSIWLAPLLYHVPPHS